MNRTLTIAILCLCSLIMGTVFAKGGQSVTVHNGFVTGQEFLDGSTQMRRYYAAGLIDGMLLAPLFGASKDDLKWVEACVVNMTDTQVAAILEKELRDHPERWHESAHVIMFAALRSRCPKQG